MLLLPEDIKTKEVLDWKGVHLLHFVGSSCSQKTRIFLNLKGIDWTSHEIDLARQKNYDPWFLGINPRGLVPVLVHDGDVHIESNDILMYLEKTFPEPPLIPNGDENNVIEELKEEDDLHLDLRNLTMRFVLPKFLASRKPATLDKYEKSTNTIQGQKDPHKEVELAFWRDFAKHGITDDQVRSSVAKFEAVFNKLNQRLEAQKYLGGDLISLLDIAWFIYAFRLEVTGYPLKAKHPALYRWFRELLAKPEFSKELIAPPPLRMVTGINQWFQRIRGKTLSEVAGF